MLTFLALVRAKLIVERFPFVRAIQHNPGNQVCAKVVFSGVGPKRERTMLVLDLSFIYSAACFCNWNFLLCVA